MADGTLKLTERHVAFLRVLADGETRHSGRIFYEAFPDAPHRGRRDAGATRTLDHMEKRGLVRGTYSFGGLMATGREWTITQAGRDALATAAS